MLHCYFYNHKEKKNLLIKFCEKHSLSTWKSLPIGKCTHKKRKKMYTIRSCKRRIQCPNSPCTPKFSYFLSPDYLLQKLTFTCTVAPGSLKSTFFRGKGASLLSGLELHSVKGHFCRTRWSHFLLVALSTGAQLPVGAGDPAVVTDTLAVARQQPWAPISSETQALAPTAAGGVSGPSVHVFPLSSFVLQHLSSGKRLSP